MGSALNTTLPVRQGIAPGLSLYLDLIRFLAAMAVVAFHTWNRFDPATTIKFPGHEAVVVFFVLSGYVIAHAASRPGVTLALYVQHRMARILPVAWVALLMAAVMAGALPQLGQKSGILAPTIANMVFLAQSGWGWMEAPLNPPFWSLNYEVWYYVIFAAWMFAPKQRCFWLGAAVLVAGPKILLLMPVWLMGVGLYHHMPAVRRGHAFALFVITVGIAAAMCWMDVSDMWRTWLYRILPPFWRAHYSTQFLYDTVLGLVVTVNFATVSALNDAVAKLRAVERPIRYLASFTFSIYVFHAPLTELLMNVLQFNHPVQFYGAMAAGVFILAQLTERRTSWYRQQIARLWTERPAVQIADS